ncbi:hypothetical protein BC827DRAFT_1266739 [Russula dissimulans]|nr:hypothetical protein BC827DRAFT_1266739 [Russula dissimulans]
MAHAAYPQPPRVEIDATDLPPPVNDDSTGSPVAQPSSSYQHEPLSPPPVHGHRRRQSLTSVVVDIQNPSLPLSTLIHPPKLTDEPFAVDSPTAPSPPVSVPVDQYDEHSLLSSISSLYFLPEGRFVRLIHSEQVPRYTKNIKMQVAFCSIVSREDTPYDVKPLTTTFPYYAEPTSPEEGSLKLDCSPWIPATHPDGALYFYDPERRLFTDTDMHSPTLWDEIEDFYRYLQQILRVDHPLKQL